MRQSVALCVTSLVSVLLSTVHLASDVVYGMSPGGLQNLIALPFLAVWLYASLVLLERRAGNAIVLIMSFVAMGLPLIHMSGSTGLTAGLKASEGLFFTWTLLFLGTTATCSAILAAQGLRALERARPS